MSAMKLLLVAFAFGKTLLREEPSAPEGEEEKPIDTFIIVPLCSFEAFEMQLVRSVFSQDKLSGYRGKYISTSVVLLCLCDKDVSSIHLY